jgi:hypothetical protein
MQSPGGWVRICASRTQRSGIYKLDLKIIVGKRIRELKMSVSKVTKTLAGAAVLGYMLMAATVAAARKLDDVSSFRCGVETVSVGDRQYTVKEACGLPEKVTVSGWQNRLPL